MTTQARSGRTYAGRDAAGRGRGTAVVLAGLVVGVLGSGTLVWQGTNAAFTASTSNGANNWSAGTVALADDDSATALFSAGPVVPGQTGARCIAVTYSGSLAATVRFYATSVTGTLAPHLDVLVEEGAGAGNVGSASDCTGFAGTQIWHGALDTLGSTVTGFGSGVGGFAPSGPGQVQVYRITWTVSAVAGDALQGTAASATFGWEARS